MKPAEFFHADMVSVYRVGPRYPVMRLPIGQPLERLPVSCHSAADDLPRLRGHRVRFRIRALCECACSGALRSPYIWLRKSFPRNRDVLLCGHRSHPLLCNTCTLQMNISTVSYHSARLNSPQEQSASCILCKSSAVKGWYVRRMHADVAQMFKLKAAIGLRGGAGLFGLKADRRSLSACPESLPPLCQLIMDVAPADIG